MVVIAPRRLALTLEYDGRAYAGWQSQPQRPTVQTTVADALQALTGERLTVEGAGRTDAGVHALGQVAAMTTTSSIPTESFAAALNTRLPPDIACVRAETMPLDFDPQRHAIAKTYRYMVVESHTRSPLWERRAWVVRPGLDMAAMAQAGRNLLGRHDFASFQAAGSSVASTIRTLMQWHVRTERHPGMPGRPMAFTCTATGFLRHMVRNIIGTLVAVGRGEADWSPAAVAEALAARDRAAAGPTAPAHGLYLMRVWYALPCPSGGQPGPEITRRNTEL